MLTLVVKGAESYDEESEEFVYPESFELQLEHSLVSLSKWESKFEKPFLGKDEKTAEEVLSYFKLMIVSEDFPPDALERLSQENIDEINKYLTSSMTATWFSEVPNASQSRQVITAELIYSWMFAFNISMECQYWHLNRLFTLIKVCNAQTTKPKPMSREEQFAQQRALNAKRKQELGTRG